MFEYAICNETFTGWDWESTCREVARCGYDGIEVAPFTFAEDVRTIPARERAIIRETAAAHGLKIVGLHWLLVSPKGLSITSDEGDVRALTSRYLEALVHFCADLGAGTMVLGSPAQRRLPANCPNPLDTACERLEEALIPALEAAETRGVVLCLEPLPPPEADFIMTLAEARARVDAIGHACAATMLDVKSASSEAVPIPDLIRTYHALIRHVHANDANLRGPGFGNTDFRPILTALREVGYRGPVSVEVFDYSPDPVTIASKSIEYLRACEPANGEDPPS